MAFFHCASSLLGVGSIIEPGNRGRIIRNFGWGHTLAARETVLEEVRKASFPGKPSRLDSLFFFDDDNEALFYANSDGRQATMIAYEVELLDSAAPRHKGDWRNVAAKGSLDFAWAEDYWKGQMLPPHHDPLWNAQCSELVAVTAARIIRRL